ncbi:D-alanyl-D-alanine carboxypeptidase/D-alanyl-D-alanine-endopeptidase [Candidatus Sumerlaeota bacterium]|nr:D-alanyl-D-alanine carboxypeptidase/D-alanyl-D-alanine-endopeptidase [Candidatus Sumerlaeota bacterium]
MPTLLYSQKTRRTTHSRLSYLLIFLLLFLLNCTLVQHTSDSLFISPEEQIQRRLSEIFSAPAFENAFWGVMVQDVESGRVLFQRNAEKSLMPASNMKLYTTSVALVLLGPDYRYRTRIYYQGTIDKQGTLNGDIIVKGSGDPSINDRYHKDTSLDQILLTWAEAIQSAGIKRISGDIIGDDDIFDDNEIGGTWDIGYLSYWYATGSSGLAIANNCYTYEVRAGEKPGDPAIIRISPETDYITVINDVVTTGEGGVRSVDIHRTPLTNTVRFFGSIPLNAQPVRHFASVYNGTLYTVFLLKEKLEQIGIEVEGQARDIDEFADKSQRLTPERWHLIYTHYSYPLRKLIRVVNKPSQNFYADMLLKTLGAEFKGIGGFETGGEVVKEFLRSIGMPDVESFRMFDGSGLSRRNLVQPRQTVYLLRYMIRHPYGKYFYESLPIAGVDGTLRGRMRDSPAANNVHAKTGYIGYVRTLSGYVTTASGRRLVFSMMANHYTVPTREANRLQDSACVFLASLEF